MHFEVLLTDHAAQDLTDIYQYILENDTTRSADYVLSRIEATFKRLASLPERGRYPKELLALGIRDYREVYFKPYRIIHRAVGQQVLIFCIADGRRNLGALLQRRLLGD